MANPEAESISSYLLQLVEIAQRQLDLMQRSEESFRHRMVLIDEKFAHAADMFVQVGAWVRGQGDEIVRTNERLAAVAAQVGGLAERQAFTEERMARAEERMAQSGERMERLEQEIAQLLRALLRGRGDGEGTDQA